MISFEHVPSWYWASIGVLKYCMNVRENLLPNLWALWGNEVSTEVLFVSDQCIALEISCHQSTVYIAAVYASIYYLKRRQLWDALTNLQGCFQGPWLLLDILMPSWVLMRSVVVDLLLHYHVWMF
jgi:hypothetical protein